MPWFTPRRYIQQRTTIVEPTKSNGRSEWLIARSLCHYRCFDLSDIPPTKRDNSLSWQIRQWSPFSDYGEYTVWQQGKAQVWVWDAKVQAAAQSGCHLKQTKLLPETLLHVPARNHLQLQRCSEGVEVRWWQNGSLAASRWWPEIPDAQRWQHFLRAHRLPLDTAIPEPQALTWLPTPWGKARRALSGVNHLRREGLWLTIGVTLFLGVLVWQGMAVWRQQQALAAVTADIENLTEHAGPILQARNQAIADQNRVRELLRLNEYPSQLRLLAEITALFPDPSAQLREWRYYNGELRFTVEAPMLDPKSYVQLLQTHPLLKDIKTENGRTPQQLVLHIRLTPP